MENKHAASLSSSSICILVLGESLFLECSTELFSSHFEQINFPPRQPATATTFEISVGD